MECQSPGYFLQPREHVLAVVGAQEINCRLCQRDGHAHPGFSHVQAYLPVLDVRPLQLTQIRQSQSAVAGAEYERPLDLHALLVHLDGLEPVELVHCQVLPVRLLQLWLDFRVQQLVWVATYLPLLHRQVQRRHYGCVVRAHRVWLPLAVVERGDYLFERPFVHIRQFHAGVVLILHYPDDAAYDLSPGW